jgi:hypothetical protein
MSYALIPDGYTLKKVTKLQKQALNDKRRHDNVVAFINNPELMKQIIITGFAFLAVKEGQEVIEGLKEAGANISDATIDAYKKKRDVGAPVGVSIEQIINEGFRRLGFGD